MAEGVGFEPTVRLPVLLISSQMPLTTQPPFQTHFGVSAGAVLATDSRLYTTTGYALAASCFGASRKPAAYLDPAPG